VHDPGEVVRLSPFGEHQLCQAPVSDPRLDHGQVPAFFGRRGVQGGRKEPFQFRFHPGRPVADSLFCQADKPVTVVLEPCRGVSQECPDEGTDGDIRVDAFLLVECLYLDTGPREAYDHPRRRHPLLAQAIAAEGAEFPVGLLLVSPVIGGCFEPLRYDAVADDGDLLLVSPVVEQAAVFRITHSSFHERGGGAYRDQVGDECAGAVEELDHLMF